MSKQNTERKLIRTLKETITQEEYIKVLNRLIDIAINGFRDVDAIQAAKIIIERLEGSVPQPIVIKTEEALDEADKQTLWDKYRK